MYSTPAASIFAARSLTIWGSRLRAWCREKDSRSRMASDSVLSACKVMGLNSFLLEVLVGDKCAGVEHQLAVLQVPRCRQAGVDDAYERVPAVVAHRHSLLGLAGVALQDSGFL